MTIISVKTAQSNYDVVIGAKLSELETFHKLSGAAVAIVEEAVNDFTDLSSFNLPKRVVKGGESIKTFAQIEKLCEMFLELGVDKSSVVLAVGGGALSDAVGFAASIFNRGTSCITIPTTLLAQVDASIGGKNGVNFRGVKNIIGTIVQPKLVLCDLSYLQHLPSAEISAGMAEIIKAGIIADPSLIELLKASQQHVFDIDQTRLGEIIFKAVKVKADIVSRDEKESHERMKLNYGHTIGHALEVSCGLSHGEAVACGMIMETKLAVVMGLCSEEVVGELISLCELYKLPTEVDFDIEKVCTLMLQDKKKRSNRLNFALPSKIGSVNIIEVEIDEIKKYISNLRISQ